IQTTQQIHFALIYFFTHLKNVIIIFNQSFLLGSFLQNITYNFLLFLLYLIYQQREIVLFKIIFDKFIFVTITVS
ncbi:MAG: hypothetical protein ACK55Z_26115, partial [bacterium]